MHTRHARVVALIGALALAVALTSCRRPGQPGTTTTRPTIRPTTTPTTGGPTTSTPGPTVTNPPPSTTPTTRPPNPVPSSNLSTSGRKIVDKNGREVLLQGVNWFGFETGTRFPHGLWTRDYVDMLKQIRSLGYNTIRLPFSIDNYRYSGAIQGINTSNGMNAGLNGKTPAQLMETIIAEAGRQGLYVFLDNHSAANDAYQQPFWYDGSHSDADWVSMWRDVARQFSKYSNVIGADLKNEPHGKVNENGSNWGEGGPNDWWAAATRAGNAVLAEAPNWLIIVEGIERPVPGGTLQQNWWGGNLEGVKNKPVVLNIPNRVVYSPHEYGPGVYAQPWFNDPSTMSAALASRWQAGWGYIAEQNIAPLLLGEFGAKDFSMGSTEGKWMNQLIDYLGTKKMSWTYWSWNPDSGDTGGILNDDWTTVNQTKQTALNRLLAIKP